MNDIEGTITSSPGPIPDDVERELQRGRAVGRRDGVARADALGEGRLELAHARALGDPAGGDRLGDRGALVAAQVGTAERDLHQAARAELGDRQRRGAVALGAPPLDEAGEAFLEVDLGLEAELLARGARVRQPPGDAVDGARRAVLDREVRAHHLQQHLGQLEQARLGPAGDVEDDVGEVGGGGEHVRARDVAHVDEVHRLRGRRRGSAAACRR